MARSKSKVKRMRHRWALKAKRRKEAKRLQARQGDQPSTSQAQP
ncbi:MAG: hypothetical protein ABIK44_07240 [candidate division WOR-3 bacterium]